MELLGVTDHVESRIGPFRDGVSVVVRCTVCTKLTNWLKIHFGDSRWYSLVMRLKWKLISVRLVIVLILR
jgi:hypothetical protein